MPGKKLPILTITNTEYYRDDGLYIHGLTDGILDINADKVVRIDSPTTVISSSTVIALSGSTTIQSGKTFTIAGAGAVDLGTGNLAIGGNTTLAGGKYLEFSPGASSMRFPNDGVIASGQWWKSGSVSGLERKWTTPIKSGNVCGWIRVKVASGSTNWHTLYAPLFSSNNMILSEG